MPVCLCKQIAFKTAPFSKQCIFGKPSYKYIHTHLYLHPGVAGSGRSGQYVILIKCFVTTCSAHNVLDVYAVTCALWLGA